MLVNQIYETKKDLAKLSKTTLESLGGEFKDHSTDDLAWLVAIKLHSQRALMPPCGKIDLFGRPEPKEVTELEMSPMEVKMRIFSYTDDLDILSFCTTNSNILKICISNDLDVVWKQRIGQIVGQNIMHLDLEQFSGEFPDLLGEPDKKYEFPCWYNVWASLVSPFSKKELLSFVTDFFDDLFELADEYSSDLQKADSIELREMLIDEININVKQAYAKGPVPKITDWQTFVKAHGGEGKTLEQLSAMYQKTPNYLPLWERIFKKINDTLISERKKLEDKINSPKEEFLEVVDEYLLNISELSDEITNELHTQRASMTPKGKFYVAYDENHDIPGGEEDVMKVIAIVKSPEEGLEALIEDAGDPGMFFFNQSFDEVTPSLRENFIDKVKRTGFHFHCIGTHCYSMLDLEQFNITDYDNWTEETVEEAKRALDLAKAGKEYYT